MTDNTNIKNALLSGGYVSKEDMAKTEEFSKKHKISIVEYLLYNELITKDILGQATAEAFKVHYADLNTYQPSREQISKIPEEIAKKYRVVLFEEKAKEVVITTDNPAEPKLASELKKLLADIIQSKKIVLAYSLTEDIEEAFINYRKALETRFVSIIKSEKRVAPEIIEEIIQDAILYRASDIHFEPQDKEVVIRFRIDGVLNEAGRIPKEYYENILNSIKVKSRLRLDEHFSAQDGAIHFDTTNKMVDLRVSITPLVDGEKVVIRVLSEYVKGFTLASLGLSETNQKIFLSASHKPFGMIMVTGPTGSGKTTTLYALVKILNQPEKNITTIEDPVEYKIEGVNQIQVNSQTNLTFAEGLRSIARQDPDIILVGEIRDKETADIAVNAALTGHLLLSTFHANDAATAIPRLLEMGIEPFLLASTLQLVVAQRLVRRICEHCRTSVSVNIKKEYPHLVKYFPSKSKTVTLYKGKGCQSCNDTGYKGRVAIFEFIDMSKEMAALILKNPSTNEIRDLSRKQGAISLFEDGLEKVKSAITTMEELLHTAPPQD
ncbi:MAG: GspE/PulE family protein [bacterium]|nr:GspE/PulE family protein [bacterium]